MKPGEIQKMKPVLFYGVPQGCSFGSIVALEWLGVPYQLCRIEMLEHPWPALFARLNPLNLTPSLLTDDDQGTSEQPTLLSGSSRQREVAG
jgi:glutathione S-transferase